MELDGHIIEFLESGALRLGYVRRREQRKIQVIDQRGRESSVPVSRVVVVHAAVPEEEFKETAASIQERIDSLCRDVDVELLWESVQTESREFDPAELAESYFGAPSPESQSAIFRELADGGLFFKRNGTRFQPRARLQVDSQRLRIAREQEKEDFRKHVGNILNRAIQTGTPPDAHDWESISERLEKWLRRRERDEVGSVLEQLAGESRARDIAYDLLVQSGRIEAWEDRFLIIHGVATSFPAEVVEAANNLDPNTVGGRREDWSGRLTLAIDDEATVEVDDALTVSEDAGNLTVGIHIADVSAFVNKGDQLDREAFKRSTTLYLPNVSVTMFPPRLSTDLASLIKGERRPAFSVEVRFNRDNELVDSRVFRTTVTVTDRLSYEAADRLLEERDTSLVRLHQIALHLQEQRSDQGAQTHRRPEIKIRVDDGDISVQRIEVDTPARLIVSEMMILANSLAADSAATTGVPIIFRTQEAPDSPPPDIEGFPEAIQFELLRRSFKRSRLSLSPGPHSGLGLGAYAQVSSPIRRYADLVTQRQFVAAIEGTPFPYDREELLVIITSAEAAELDMRRLEQTSTMYWILTHLSRDKMDEPIEALVIDGKGTVELTDYLIRGKVSDGTRWHLGDSITVKIESIDPIRGDILFRACS